MIYYHGTTSINAENIKNNGISPVNSKYAGKVYLTTNYGEASKYAKIASNGKPGKVLKIHSDNLKSEHIHSNNSGIIEYKGSIHPQHISEETNVGMIAGSGDSRLPPDQREPGFNINIKKNKKILRRKKLNLKELQLKLNEDVESLSDEDLLSLVENIDRLDELSKETLLNYVKAANHAGHAYRTMQGHANSIATYYNTLSKSKDKDFYRDKSIRDARKYSRHAYNRQMGIDTAIKKLMAKKTANEDYLDTNRDLIEAVIEQSPSDFYERFSNNIYSKISDYVDNMKEDVAKDLFESGRLDELSKETLTSYVQKADKSFPSLQRDKSKNWAMAIHHETEKNNTTSPKQMAQHEKWENNSLRKTGYFDRKIKNRIAGTNTAFKKLMSKVQAEK